MASLEEMKNLSLVVGRMENERNYLVSTTFQGAAEGQPFFRQEGQLGMLLNEQAGVQRMQVHHMEREMHTAKKRGAIHRSVNKTLKKQLSIIGSSISARCNFPSFSRLVVTSADRFFIQYLRNTRNLIRCQVPGIRFIRRIPGII